VDSNQQELRRFIEAALSKGASDRFVADMLKAGGWAEKEIFAAFREHYEQATGVSLPARRESAESSRDAFLYLIIFSTLATWTVALGSLLFKLIDRWFPDVVSMRGGYYPYDRLDLSFQIACILVAFPVYLLVAHKVNQGVAKEPRNRYSPVRKWLTYIALVIASCVLIGDAVSVLAHFLQGEVSLRFLMKVLVVGVIAAGVFGYYLGEVGTVNMESDPRRRKIFSASAVATVAVALLLGFTATGGPSTQRGIQADVQRVRDLHHIAETIRNAVLNGPASIPKSLDQVPAAGGYTPRITDPESGAMYEYVPRSEVAYELCATFAHDNREGAQQRRNRFWVHSLGRQCFQLNAKQPTPSEF
jgi:hypothetical protein